ncbi:hypothetical protein FYK35_20515 [Enterobacter hormaechei]|nr:hypothetical protein [Salmonella enterica]TYR67527.1 hypothetical protein FYK35_20515 [Enterobacter hormaechei]
MFIYCSLVAGDISRKVRHVIGIFDNERRVSKLLGSNIDIKGVVSENGIYGHSRFCNTDFDDKLACLNLSGV